MAAKITNGGRIVDARCAVVDERNGVVYRCSKNFGHEHVRGNEEHEVQASEYVTLDWHLMFEVARPLLEWMAANPAQVGQERNELARRLLVRAYTANHLRPGIAKTKTS